MNENNGIAVVRSLSRVEEWEVNPRGNSSVKIEEMMESLTLMGLQDAIHIWPRPDRDLLLKGHRRFAAMTRLGWQECAQVIHHFDDEAEAFKYLLQDHGHTEPLNAEEKVCAIENGVRLGLTISDLAPAMGVSEERAQLWFDLGEGLSQAGRSALAKGTLTVNVAEVLLQVPDKKERAAATQMVLADMLGEPLSYKAARDLVEANYILPAKYRRQWLEMQTQLKKKFKVIDGYSYVDYEMMGDYTMGLSGQPYPDFEYGDGLIPKGAEGERWQEKAKRLGVPVYVVAAPLHCDKYVLLVSWKMIRDAESVKPAEKPAPDVLPDVPETHEEDQEQMRVDFTNSQEPEVVHGIVEMDDELRGKIKLYMGAIWEALQEKPAAAMANGPWALVLERLVFEAHVSTESALNAWLGILTTEDLELWLQQDRRQRGPLRHVLLLLLAAEIDAIGAPEYQMKRMAAELGCDLTALEEARW
jgi:ParB-like chromosome segregation protein Spo0J